ncbi:MAG: C69 family dipeptidase, partial [Oscillospiraceae bacterium]|nr:C69 family dipeptidase [Oscillospiraceae bacterium]
MHKPHLTLVLSTLFFLIPALEGNTCTNVIITKGASKDGSTLVTYAADSHYLFGELYYHPAADWKAGSVLQVHDWDSGKYLGDIDQVPHTFQTVGNMNEKQVIITETTWGGREELMDRRGCIDYG